MKSMIIGEIHKDAERILDEKTDLKKINEEEFRKLDYFDCDILVIRTFTKIGKNELKKFKNLKYLISCSVGTDNIDTESLKEKNVKLFSSQGTNANSVAEHVIYLILSLIRKDTEKPFFELKGKTLGLIGFGAIGKEVARKLQGFEVNLIAYDIVEQDKKLLDRLNVKIKDINEILNNSDIVSVHVPLNKKTSEFINDEIFEKMKDRSFFINTSRAEVIDEDALVDYFKKGKFRGIALDVYSNNLKNKLNKGNVILTNHVAAQGEDSFKKMCLEPIKNLFFRLNI